MNIIDTHIQLVFNEFLDSDLINNELFRTISFKTKKDFEFLKKNNANNVLIELNKKKYKNWSFYGYGFCCRSQTLNSLQNELLLDAANNFENLNPIAVINPLEISEYEISQIIEKFRGIHIKPEWINPSPEKINIKNNILSIIQESKIPLFIHIGYLYNMNKIKFNYVEYLRYILKNFPDLRIILEHCGGGVFLAETYEPWEKLFKNVCYSISSPRSPLLIESLFRTINIKKICFGSDFPFCDNKTPIEYYNDVETILKKTGTDLSNMSYLFKKWFD